MRYTIPAIAIAASLALAGCSDGGGSNGGVSDGEGSDLTTGVMLLNGDTYFTAVADGYKRASNGETIVENYDGDAAKEAQAVDNLISRQVDAIVTSPLDGTASASTLKRASDSGIKVVCYNTCVDEDKREGIVSAFVLSDQAGMGKQTGTFAADWIKKNVKGEAVFGVLHCDSFDICRQRKDAFFTTLDAAGVNYRIAAQEEELVVDKAVPAGEDMLTSNPDINVLWSANDGGTTGLVRAAESSGRDIKVFGSDMTPVLADMLLQQPPTLLTTTGQDGTATGEKALDVVQTLIDGDDVDPFVQEVPVVNYSVDDLDAVRAYVEAN